MGRDGEGLGAAEESTTDAEVADFLSKEEARDDLAVGAAFCVPAFLFVDIFGRGHSKSLLRTTLEPDTHSSSRLLN